MRTIVKALPAFRRQYVRSAVAGLLVSAFAVMSAPELATAASPAVSAHQHDAAVSAPDAATVLKSIYNVAGDGSDSYDVGKGVTATYWFGHAFECDGKQYFTGFAWETLEKQGDSGEAEAAPEAQVNLSEATFMLSDGSWSLQHAARDIGAMGSYEKPDEVDTDRKAVEHRTPAGKLVLAIPIAGFDRGTSYSGYDVFALGKSWTHVGYLLAGEDNGAACSDGEVMPCISNLGEVTFAPDDKSDMPKLVVNFSGTTISAPGKTRELGAADAATYVYDASKKAYESQ
ncbi:hypothetical protein OIV19_23175 [Brucella sp. HL-2]|nr:hypothetical protein [Brucella sp. HL-2]MCV9910468.1 hypothetical protein [Brucella sp. HL-2]